MRIITARRPARPSQRYEATTFTIYLLVVLIISIIQFWNFYYAFIIITCMLYKYFELRMYIKQNYSPEIFSKDESKFREREIYYLLVIYSI